MVRSDFKSIGSRPALRAGADSPRPPAVRLSLNPGGLLHQKHRASEGLSSVG